MKELSAFKRINLLKCCDIGSQMTHFGLSRVNPLRHGNFFSNEPRLTIRFRLFYRLSNQMKTVRDWVSRCVTVVEKYTLDCSAC
jgi:hypothetical protein